MTKFPQDDEHLTAFLRQHKSPPPPATPNLEVQIMQAVASWPHQQTHRRRHLWIVSSAIAASLLMAWTTYRAILPPPPNNATVEAFMENNWDSVVADDGTDIDLLPIPH